MKQLLNFPKGTKPALWPSGNRRLYVLFAIFSWLLVAGCGDKEPFTYVDPFMGTGFHGHTYPGATAPFGAVQLSPDTRRGNWDASSGYHYSDSTIMGFSHTHLSGTGVIDLGDVLFHPTTQTVHLNGAGPLYEPVSFSHQNEEAQPGYYSVQLDNGIFCELTATPRTGMHRYTFPEGDGNIVVDLAHLLADEKIYEAALSVESERELSGMRRTRGWVDNQYVFFWAEFSRPFTSAEMRVDGKPSDEASVTGEEVLSVLSFNGNGGDPLEVKVGLSLVSVENARENMMTETGKLNFDQVKDQTRELWKQALSGYQVTGGTEAQRINFYTAVYHTMVAPNVVSDVNGAYRGADMKIYHTDGRKAYSTLSLWDTFRTWHPLMTLTDTTLVNDIINSMLRFYDQTGELPVWPLSAGETGTMIGYHSVSVIWDAYRNNIRGFDVEKALRAMVESAEKNKKGTTPYVDKGYIPDDVKRESVSRLLENAYDDWCISQMAEALGDEETATRFRKRAVLYKNVFDGHTKFFRGRLRSGGWVSPFDPFEVGRAYTEATAWQYRFFVPHDVNGMINLFGGEAAFNEALDSLFLTTGETKGHLSDITGLIGQYAHGNEPSHHIAYLYSYSGEPWKTQEWVRQILDEMYHPTPEGIVGNEDCGQMSAWYVMSSLGLYPVCPGSSQFILTSPLFEEARVQLAGGRQLRITANNPEKNQYIHQVELNGVIVNENYVTYSDIMDGGELKFILGPEPNFKRGVAPETRPASLSFGKEVSIPYVQNDITFFEDRVEIVCGTATPGAEIRYTLDGSEPTPGSPLYEAPIAVERTIPIRLRAFKEGFKPSAVASYEASRARLKPAAKVNFTHRGVHYAYYEGMFANTGDITEKGQLIKEGTLQEPTLEVAEVDDHFGIIFTGYIQVPVDGVYRFTTRSDDGTLLFIGDELVVENDGSHAFLSASGRVGLQKGLHPFRLLYFEDYEGQALSWSWEVPGEDGEKPIPAEYLFVGPN